MSRREDDKNLVKQRSKEEELEYNLRHQRYLYRQAGQRLADRNEAFMWLVNNGLTATDLRRSIERWPERYSMYAGFLDKLPP
jgi:hypothetical protein